MSFDARVIRAGAKLIVCLSDQKRAQEKEASQENRQNLFQNVGISRPSLGRSLNGRQVMQVSIILYVILYIASIIRMLEISTQKLINFHTGVLWLISTYESILEERSEIIMSFSL